MKKFLTFALLAAFTGAASAASIDWAINMGRNGTITDSAGTAITGPVYLLLANDAATLADAAEADTFAASLESLALGDPMQLTNGKKNNTTMTATSNKLTPDTSYDFVVVVYDSANGQYYTSATLTQQAYDESAETVITKQITLNTSQIGSTYSGANWSSSKPTAVPEPATGALALAGVALLFKRRRA